MKKQLLASVFSFTFISVAAVVVSGQDDKIRISGVSQKVSQDCEGKGVVVNGTSGKIQLIGDCPDVTVSGTENTVSIDKATSIRVSGVDNVITYKTSLRRKNPKISNSGVNNSVKKE